MKGTNRLLSFLAGAGTALALTACLTTALAASGKVSYNFANVSLDGTKKITAGQDITAANGQKIPGTILYTDAAGGKTNYLPIRAVSELLGVEIGYDSASKTILLGKQPIPASPKGASPAAVAAGETAPTAKPASGVPRNAQYGDKELIVKRGGTLLPDEDPMSYGGTEKLFLDKNGEARAEWMVGNEKALQASDKKLLKTLVDGDYPKNSKGESYGSTQLAQYVGYWPDLEHLAAYPPEDRPEGYIRGSELHAEGAKLNGLSKEECPHAYIIPLYDSEGTVIGEYRAGCSGHSSSSVTMTPKEAQEAYLKALGLAG